MINTLTINQQTTMFTPRHHRIGHAAKLGKRDTKAQTPLEREAMEHVAHGGRVGPEAQIEVVDGDTGARLNVSGSLMHTERKMTMNATFVHIKQGARSLARLLLYIAAFAAPLLAAVIHAKPDARQPQAELPPASHQPLPDPPAHDPTKRTAVILASNLQTESTDLLAPYEVLAASGGFNVYVVAPERRPSALYPGGLDIVPHYSFSEYDRIFGTDPDVIVVPAIPATAATDAPILEWLRAHAGERTTILSVCAGARVVAEAGLLTGRQATSNHTVLLFLEQAYPEVRWVRELRYVVDGQFISSAGVTAGVDATLYMLQQFLGRAAAEDTARRVGYRHSHYLDDRTWQIHDVDLVPLMTYTFRAYRTEIGLVLYDGVGEIEVGSVVDTYPYAYANVRTVAPERRVVRSRYGLDLIPRYELSSAPTLHRVLIPGHPDAEVRRAIEQWAAAQARTVETIHAGGGFPYDVTLSDIARQETRSIAASVARDIEYPIDHLRLEGNTWPLGLLTKGIALSLIGLALALGVRRALYSLRRAQMRPT